jgi:mRNA interferase RelE/StbE
VYAVILLSPAVRDLKAISRPHQERIRDHIDKLAENPRPPGAKALKHGAGRWRIRVGDYRVIYRIEDDRLVVLVIKIGHRREVYWNL